MLIQIEPQFFLFLHYRSGCQGTQNIAVRFHLYVETLCQENIGNRILERISGNLEVFFINDHREIISRDLSSSKRTLNVRKARLSVSNVALRQIDIRGAATRGTGATARRRRRARKAETA